MAFYDDLFNDGNTAGRHTFDADILGMMPPGWSHEHVSVDPKGERVRMNGPGGRVIENILLHRRGRVAPPGPPGRDITKDVLVFDISELIGLPPPFQGAIIEFEQTPGTGRRSGVVRPPRLRLR